MTLDPRAILDWMDHALAILDEDLKMLWCNAAFCKMATGKESEGKKWLGKSLIEDGDPQRRGLLLRALHGESLHRFARMAILPGGPVRDLEIRVGPVNVGDEGRFVALSIEEGEPSSGHLAVTDAQLAAMGRLAAGIAHEFNNLHAGILGFVEHILTTRDLDEELRADLETVRELSRRASGITRNLMAFGSRRVSIMGTVSPDSLVASALAAMKSPLEVVGAKVETETSGPLPGLVVDRDQIVQVLENLIQNAVDALVGAQEKVVRLVLSQDEHFVTITVEDSGRGIMPEHEGRVFEPFFTTKGSAATSIGPDASLDGVGLGLSVCKAIVEQHGGKVEFESKAGEGSRFTIFLPKLPGFGQEDAEDGKPAEDAVPSSPADSMLLVVDDEPAVRILIRRSVEVMGWKCQEADAAQKALEMLENQHFDTVIVDMRMPGMNGDEFIERLETLPESERPAVIVCTGAIDDLDIDSDMIVGVLQKPFDLEELHRLLDRSLSR